MSWHLLDKTCQIFAFPGPKFEKIGVSLQELPKFDISLTVNARKHTLAQTKWTKLAKSMPLARLGGLKKHTLAGGTSPGTFIMEEPPPRVSILTFLCLTLFWAGKTSSRFDGQGLTGKRLKSTRFVASQKRDCLLS